jgi:hypothetical protein
MQSLSRAVGLGFILLSLAALALKALVAVPGPLGYAPVDLGIGPEVQPVEVVIWYGTEKQAWLEEAARRFEAGGAAVGGRPIRLSLVGLGSREMVDRVARQDWGGAAPPTVVSPASSLWTEALKGEWAARNGGAQILSGGAPPLVLTPLVAVAWEERAAVLWPRGAGDFWPQLHDALVDPRGWAGVAERNGFPAGSPEAARAAGWGPVKLGHTSPLSSNSGAQALLLMTYGYHGKAAGLSLADIQDPGYQQWVEQIEAAVPDFGESSGSFMTSMVQFGPSKYDVALVYENLALKSIEAARSRWGQPLRIYYPPATVLSDHPYAILGDPLTTPEQRAAAERFRDFLLERPQQELALTYGFRPASPAVPLTGADSPFVRYASYGAQPEVGQQVEAPPADVFAAMLAFWQQRIGPSAALKRQNP